MTVLKRALGTTLAAGALLLTVGALPAGAQTTVTSQVFVGTAYSGSSFASNLAAYNGARAQATAAGYTSAQCSLTFGPVALRISPTLWKSTAALTCNA